MPSDGKNRTSKGPWRGQISWSENRLPMTPARAEVARDTWALRQDPPTPGFLPHSQQNPVEPWNTTEARAPACASTANYYQPSWIRKLHLFGKRSNKGPDEFIFSHIKFQLNYTCTALCCFGNTGTQFNDSNFFVVFFFYKSGAITFK